MDPLKPVFQGTRRIREVARRRVGPSAYAASDIIRAVSVL